MTVSSVIIWTRSAEDWAADELRLQKLVGSAYRHIPCLRLIENKSVPKLNPNAIVLLTSVKSASIMSETASWRDLMAKAQVVTFSQKAGDIVGKFVSHCQVITAKTGRDFFSKLISKFDTTSSFVYVGTDQPAFDLAGELIKLGYRCASHVIYRTEEVVNADVVTALARENVEGAICFASPSAVRGFCRSADATRFDPKKFSAVVIGQTTAEALPAGWREVIQCSSPSLDSLMERAAQIVKGEGP